MKNLTCHNCQNSFLGDRDTRKFCSRQCAFNAKRKLEKRICKGCGTEFVKNPSHVEQYCSRMCWKKHIHLKDSRTVKICKFCKKQIYVIAALLNRKNYCSRKCYTNHKSILVKGKNNPAYKNGSSYNKRSYRGDNWEKIRLKVYARDNFTCTQCNTKCIGRRDINMHNKHLLIQCHHIIPYKVSFDNSLDNLKTLCCRCHGVLETKCKL